MVDTRYHNKIVKNWIIKYSFIIGTICKIVADVILLLVFFKSTNYEKYYFGHVPFIFLTLIFWSIWASSRWIYVFLVTGVFLVNMWLCWYVSRHIDLFVIMFVIMHVFWGFAIISCFLARLTRWLFTE